MNSYWIFDKTFISKIQKIVDENKDSEIVNERIRKNIKRENINLNKNEIWRILIGCHITSNQKSGKGSPSDRFLNSNNFILKYDNCIGKSKEYIATILRSNSIRYYQRIAEQLIDNLNKLETGEWNILCRQLNSLNKEHSREDEIRVIEYILEDKKFKGIGFKQSRNFLQWLGLTIYEIPIDSRVCNILRKNGCNFIPGSNGLQDEVVYNYLEEGLQILASKLEIKPCILDACLFNSFE